MTLRHERKITGPEEVDILNIELSWREVRVVTKANLFITVLHTFPTSSRRKTK